MGRLRLIVIVVAMSCGSESKHEPGSGSAAHSGITPPPGWQALPALAVKLPDVVGSEAWGDTARGCYAAWIALRGGGAPSDKMAEQLIQSVSGAVKGITVRDVQKPAAGDTGVIALGFDAGVYHGKLRAQLSRAGTVAALTCFWNQREPAACEAACTKLLGSAP